MLSLDSETDAVVTKVPTKTTFVAKQPKYKQKTSDPSKNEQQKSTLLSFNLGDKRRIPCIFFPPTLQIPETLLSHCGRILLLKKNLVIQTHSDAVAVAIWHLKWIFNFKVETCDNTQRSDLIPVFQHWHLVVLKKIYCPGCSFPYSIAPACGTSDCINPLNNCTVTA